MKNIKSIFFINSLLLFGLSLQNCDKDCDANCTEIKEAPKEFLDYWYFPKGSWRVYQLEDSTQDVFDTLTIPRSSRFFETTIDGCSSQNRKYPPCISRYELYLLHSNNDYFPGNGIPTSVWDGVGWEALYCEYNPNNGKWYLGQSAGTSKLHSYQVFVLYPFDTLHTYSYGGKLCGLDESYEFQGEEYISFSVCKQIDQVGDGLIYQKMTFAQGIGLVSITYDNEETWNLIDYQINL